MRANQDLSPPKNVFEAFSRIDVKTNISACYTVCRQWEGENYLSLLGLTPTRDNLPSPAVRSALRKQYREFMRVFAADKHVLLFGNQNTPITISLLSLIKKINPAMELIEDLNQWQLYINDNNLLPSGFSFNTTSSSTSSASQSSTSSSSSSYTGNTSHTRANANTTSEPNVSPWYWYINMDGSEKRLKEYIYRNLSSIYTVFLYDLDSGPVYMNVLIAAAAKGYTLKVKFLLLAGAVVNEYRLSAFNANKAMRTIKSAIEEMTREELTQYAAIPNATSLLIKSAKTMYAPAFFTALMANAEKLKDKNTQIRLLAQLLLDNMFGAFKDEIVNYLGLFDDINQYFLRNHKVSILYYVVTSVFYFSEAAQQGMLDCLDIIIPNIDDPYAFTNNLTPFQKSLSTNLSSPIFDKMLSWGIYETDTIDKFIDHPHDASCQICLAPVHHAEVKRYIDALFLKHPYLKVLLECLKTIETSLRDENRVKEKKELRKYWHANYELNVLHCKDPDACINLAVRLLGYASNGTPSNEAQSELIKILAWKGFVIGNPKLVGIAATWAYLIYEKNPGTIRAYIASNQHYINNIFSANIEPNKNNRRETNILCWAAAKGLITTVKLLLLAGATFHQLNSSLDTLVVKTINDTIKAAIDEMNDHELLGFARQDGTKQTFRAHPGTLYSEKLFNALLSQSDLDDKMALLLALLTKRQFAQFCHELKKNMHHFSDLEAYCVEYANCTLLHKMCDILFYNNEDRILLLNCIDIIMPLVDNPYRKSQTNSSPFTDSVFTNDKFKTAKLISWGVYETFVEQHFTAENKQNSCSDCRPLGNHEEMTDYLMDLFKQLPYLKVLLQCKALIESEMESDTGLNAQNTKKALRIKWHDQYESQILMCHSPDACIALATGLVHNYYPEWQRETREKVMNLLAANGIVPTPKSSPSPVAPMVDAQDSSPKRQPSPSIAQSGLWSDSIAKKQKTEAAAMLFKLKNNYKSRLIATTPVGRLNTQILSLSKESTINPTEMNLSCADRFSLNCAFLVMNQRLITTLRERGYVPTQETAMIAVLTEDPDIIASFYAFPSADQFDVSKALSRCSASTKELVQGYLDSSKAFTTSFSEMLEDEPSAEETAVASNSMSLV